MMQIYFAKSFASEKDDGGGDGGRINFISETLRCYEES